MNSLLRFIPPVHELQRHERFYKIMKKIKIDNNKATDILKETVANCRHQIARGSWNGAEPGSTEFQDQLLDMFETRLNQVYSYTLKSVINATGTILHTNLGRARLSDTAMKHVIETATNFSNLEYNLHEGERGSRHVHVEDLIVRLTGAEAAMVVNNNAAAVYLILRALAHGKKVIVSRGQLVEIGGSFRISSIMEESGAKLIEVGTTNKTHLYDYEEAIDDETAMLLKVHTSNFQVVGFTKTVETKSLVTLAKDKEQLLVYEDLGSGALFDFSTHGIGNEPVIREILSTGVDVVSFSGDKLLGGPQAGIIAGRKDIIQRLKKHQLARVLRVDKMTLAALEGTLLDYAKGIDAIKTIPVIRDLLAAKEDIQIRADTFISKLVTTGSVWSARTEESFSQVGGGTMPTVELPTVLIKLKHMDVTAATIAGKLRIESTPSIIVRIQKDEVLIDLRTVTPLEEESILSSLKAI